MIFIFKKIFNTLLIISQYSPIALLWMIKAFTFDFFAQKWFFSRLLVVAPRIGLQHKPSKYIKEFGEFQGNINGHDVCVILDNRMESKISVNLKNSYQGFEISLSKSNRRLEKNTVNFKTLNWKFNWTFKTKQASSYLAKEVIKNNVLINLLNSFYAKWIFKLDKLVIDNNEIYCTLKYGFIFFPYIPASKLESLISELIAIADRLESISKETVSEI